MVVMMDERTKGKFARIVYNKGTVGNEWLVRSMRDELRSWGYPQGGKREPKLTMISDNEAIIIALKNMLATEHQLECTIEQPPAGGAHCQADGLIEEAGKTLREYVRIFKTQIKHNTGNIIDTYMPIVEWAVRWAGLMLTRCKRQMIAKQHMNG